MQTHDDRPVGGPFVEVVHPQRAAVLVGYVDVVGGERVVGQVGETVVGGAQRLHGVNPRSSMRWRCIRCLAPEATVGLVGRDFDSVQVVAEFDRAGEVCGGERSPVGAVTAGRDRRHVVGEHQRVDPGASGRLCGLLRRRVVVERVLHALQRDLVDDVLADHGVHQRIRSGAQPVETLTRHGVAGGHDRRTATVIGVIEPEPDGRVDRLVIGRRTRDLHVAPEIDLAVLDFDHGDLGEAVDQVLVMVDAVADIGSERRHDVVDDLLCADRADDRQRCRLERHHPPGGDHVVEVGDVVAVEVCQQHRRQVRSSEAERCETHQHAASGVDQVVLGPGALAGRDQRGGSGSVGARHRAAGAQQGDGQAH